MRIEKNYILLFLGHAVFFAIAQTLAIFTAVKIRALDAQGLLDVDLEQVSAPPDVEPWRFLVVLAVFSAVLFLVLKVPKAKSAVLKLLFVVIAWWGGVIVLSLSLGVIIALILMSAFILLWIFSGTVILHNILVILGVAGISGGFGLRFTPETVIFLLAVFAIYDVIAVYKTKHMIKLARAMMEARSLIAVISADSFRKFFDKVKSVETEKGFMMLGGGDIAFPAMLASSASASSLEDAFIVVGFAVLGLFATLAIFLVLAKKPMPALPPIAIFSILGFVVAKII